MKASIRTILFLILTAVWVAPARAAAVGDPAPAFDLKDLSGQSVSLASLKGKVVFLNIWATWCPPCNDEFPRLNRLAASYPKGDVVVLAVSIDKENTHVQRFLKKIKDPLALQVLMDPKGSVPAAYKAPAMPSSYVIDKSGVVRYVHQGFKRSDEPAWTTEVNSLLGAAR